MSGEVIFTNAQLITADALFDGTLVVADGRITAVDEGPSRLPEAIDCDGDFILPGLVELHTDHLEQHLNPRPRVKWPAQSALQAFDAQVAASGITTVFDCVRAGSDTDYSPVTGELVETVGEINRAKSDGVLRADHHIHIRCEICADDVLPDAERLLNASPIGLISLMDHTPGARQFEKLEAWRVYYGGKSGRSERELDELIEKKHRQFAKSYTGNRRALVALAKQHAISLASHDDANRQHVQEAISEGVSLAEFPTTLTAAELANASGIGVLMGAPNVVRGGSHSGNVAAESLARANCLDILSSDYVPASLLLGAFELNRRIDGYDLARAVRTVTLNPARAVGLEDRGVLKAGLTADFIRVAPYRDMPRVHEVYRQGRRVV